MLRRIQSLIPPTAPFPDIAPPTNLAAFYWHFIRQSPLPLLAMFATGIVVALMDTTVPVFIGQAAGFVAHHDPRSVATADWRPLLWLGAAILGGRPLANLANNLVLNQVITPGMTNRIRWQSHYNVVRQSWTFFQNDFAGRIAARVMQTGPSLRESITAGLSAVWYIVVYGGSAVALIAGTNLWLALPIALWFVAYFAMLSVFIPRLRDRSRAMSEARSALTGRVVDSYTNILTVKLFARAADEDRYVRDSIEAHTAVFQRQTRMSTLYNFSLSAMNALLIASTAALALYLWVHGRIGVAAIGTALPLAFQISGMSGWVGQSVNAIFENVGVVQDGMKSIAVPRQLPDRADAAELVVTAGAIAIEDLHFGYGTARGVLHGLDLAIRPGERIGLIGQSGAGKSTLVNLLLRFYAPEQGRILIDGQDIAGVTQESLRRHIAMVTQDTSLLHRSIRDNIAYGRPWASEAEIVAAARQAEAHEFIERLEDWDGRAGYEARVGERGVKLSGGQRQRIAIARVILKNAPILVLDEATSALDSEVEAAIQQQLDALMRGRTVIAIAHRLSTIARMDRLVLLDHGRVMEAGTHAELLAQNGAYARLWHRQSGGFLDAA
jgi:ATP-binding cassette subfamily B multidrug efflux pump